ncbi:hypothetical protein NUU61_009533 [Penicillium alfredii]|uniref:Thioredoxin-like fold domain-containing protein n=1 Tax=Penicillium alfredii TaxID=1506179 RepID=A0A9W9ENJ7_9EURO|nr:uncharacterized protein NUU61_009533 [Penicillium alfredii]KAJ5084954.1 hypothetical protein NUU61_009533 [Penicillium alfredii]
MMDSTQPQITLYRGFPRSGNYTWSPFVNKLEARLRFAGLAYRTEAGSPRTAPRGKIPYATISPDNASPRTIADSTLIIDQLVKDGLLDDINAHLSPSQRMQDLAMRALFEDRLYFLQSFEKWQENYYTMRDHIFAASSYPLRVVVGWLAYRKQMHILYGQGTLRFSPEEISSMRWEIWKKLSSLLMSSKSQMLDCTTSDHPFWVLGGSTPCEADATVYGFIVSTLVCSACPETQKVVKSFPILIQYAQKIHDCFFPDYVGWE